MPPLFGIAYFRGSIFTLHHSPHRLMVHMFPHVLTLDPYIRKFVSSFMMEHSHHIQFFSRAAYPLAYLFYKNGSSLRSAESTCASHPMICQYDACRSIGGMVSGYMVPSFPSSVVKLRFDRKSPVFSRCKRL